MHPTKPEHLGAEYAAQFGDEEVAAAYQHRPPYPTETFAIVEPLLGPKPRCVLELGAGTGDFTIGYCRSRRASSGVVQSPRNGGLADDSAWSSSARHRHTYSFVGDPRARNLIVAASIS
jgi:hypothetical protein